jgi:hypothetical protein
MLHEIGPGDTILRQLRDAITHREQAVISGTLASYEEYRHLTGVLAGLKFAESLVLDMKKKYETSTEDDV